MGSSAPPVFVIRLKRPVAQTTETPMITHGARGVYPM